MSAIDTAWRTLHWARDGGRGNPPEGDLDRLADLARPPALVREAVGQLAAVTAARLRLSSLGAGEVSPTIAVVAAAIGGRAHERAARLLMGLTVPRGRIDLIALHGLVSPALADDQMPMEVRTELRDKSPLTSILDFPSPGRKAMCRRLLTEFLPSWPSGANLILNTLAEPPSSAEQGLWRSEVLDGLRAEIVHKQQKFPDGALRVYQRARMWHADRHDVLVDVAEQALARYASALHEMAIATGRTLRADPQELGPLQPTVAYWRPLAAVMGAQRESVGRFVSLKGIEPALRLVATFDRMVSTR